MKKAVIFSICFSLVLIVTAGTSQAHLQSDSPEWSGDDDWSWVFEDDEYPEEWLDGEESEWLDEMRRLSGELEAYENLLSLGLIPESYHGIVEIAIKDRDIRLGILQAEAMEDYDIADMFYRELDELEMREEEELIRLEELGALEGLQEQIDLVEFAMEAALAEEEGDLSHRDDPGHLIETRLIE